MSQFDYLIAGQYAGVAKFMEQVGGSYFGPNFTLTQTPMNWLLKLGRYSENVGHGPIDLHGYWIFRTDVNKCWQAVNGGGGALQYWNEDGQAQGNPENWELFNFYAVDPNQNTVKIASGSGEGGQFINLVGDTFSCSENGDNAAIFRVQF
jgi:hypothetical protein